MSLLLDPTTTYFIGALVSLLAAGFMVFVSRGFGVYPGFRHWVAACLAYAVTMGLLLAQWLTQEAALQIAANFLYVLTAGLTLRGNARFFQRALPRWLDPGLTIAALGALALLLVFNPDRTLRMIAGSAGYAALWLANAWLLASTPVAQVGRAVRCWQASAYALLGLYVVVRTFALLAFADRLTPETSGLVTSLSFVIGTLANLAFCLGCIALTYTRAEERLTASHAALADLHRTVEAERAKLAALLGILPTGVALLDRDGRPQLANGALARILRHPDTAAIDGVALAGLAFRDATGSLRHGIPRLPADGPAHPLEAEELLITTGPAAGTWVHLAATPLPGYGSALSLADITALKRTEQRLLQQPEEIRRWNTLTLDRETRVLELKDEVNRLCRDRGLPARYFDPATAGADQENP